MTIASTLLKPYLKFGFTTPDHQRASDGHGPVVVEMKVGITWWADWGADWAPRNQTVNKNLLQSGIVCLIGKR